jgi:predicted Zn-dependent protease
LLTRQGSALIGYEKHPEGIEYLQKAIALGNNSPTIWNNLGSAYFHTEDYQRAL